MSEPKARIPLPERNSGAQREFKAAKRTSSVWEARQLFVTASKRLLDVNSWDKICGKASAVFHLTNEKGEEINGKPSPGCYFKIDIPGPGPASGGGYDWVQVEALEEKENLTEDWEFILIRVRPSPRPGTSGKKIAHFFSGQATSNFVIYREKNIVTSTVYGRNEVPNSEDKSSIRDKIRNIVAGIGAALGLSTPQWQCLVNGLLEQ